MTEEQQQPDAAAGVSWPQGWEEGGHAKRSRGGAGGQPGGSKERGGAELPGENKRNPSLGSISVNPCDKQRTGGQVNC